MPWGALLGAIAAPIANNLFGGGGGGGGGGGSSGMPNAYVPTGQAGADQNWQDILLQMMKSQQGQGNLISPYLQGAFGDTSGQYSDLSKLMQQWGATLGGQAGTQFGAGDALRTQGNDIWKTAQDPNNALHDRLQQQTQDASRASTSARGIGMSPAAAGLEDQAVGDFNANWQQQMLQRMLMGGQGMNSAYGQAGNLGQLGGQDLSGAQGMYQGAGQLPFNLANMFGNGMNTNIYGPQSGMQNNISQYLGMGQSGSQQAFNQGQTNLNNWTTLGGQLGKLFQNSGSGTGSGNPGSGSSSGNGPNDWGG